MITYKTFLMYSATGAAGSYSKLLPIKDFSDLGGDPEKIDRTTFDNHTTVYERGIQTLDPFEFTGNFDPAKYQELHNMEQNPDGSAKEWYFAVWFGGTGEGETLTPTGDNGQYKFKGQISTKIVGASVNSLVEVKVTITPVTSPTFSLANSATYKTISYNKNDENATGSIAPQSAAAGTVVRLSNGEGLVAASGYHFTGWATSASGTVAYQGGASFTIPNSDTELFAVWAENV